MPVGIAAVIDHGYESSSWMVTLISAVIGLRRRSYRQLRRPGDAIRIARGSDVHRRAQTHCSGLPGLNTEEPRWCLLWPYFF
jgi:hypothetical protein